MSLQPINSSARPPIVSSENSSNAWLYTSGIIGSLAIACIFRVSSKWIQHRNYEKVLHRWVTEPSQPTQSGSQENSHLPEELKNKAKERILKYKAFNRPNYFIMIHEEEKEGSLHLNLSDLNLRSLPPIEEPHKIYNLQAAGNYFSPSISFEKFPYLRTLDLSHSCDQFIPNLTFLKELVMLDLSSNRIREFPLQTIPQTKHPFFLKLKNNAIKEIPKAVFKWPRNYKLDLRDNILSLKSIKAIIIASMNSIGPTILFKLHLPVHIQSNNNMGLEKVPQIRLRSIYTCNIIDLRKNFIEEIPEGILTLPNSFIIDLRGNPLTYETKSMIKSYQRKRNNTEDPSGPEILFDAFTRPDNPSSSWSNQPLEFLKLLEDIERQNIRDQGSNGPLRESLLTDSIQVASASFSSLYSSDSDSPKDDYGR